MARIRTVKPELFKHEGLGELSPLHRVVFMGLFCVADREGRLKDRPRSIKLEVAPWDDCDIDAILNDLADAPDRFIERYTTHDGQAIIQIRAFGKHQAVNAREAASDLPARDDHATLTRPVHAREESCTREVHARDACPTREVLSRGEGKGRERKGREGGAPGAPASPASSARSQCVEILRGHPWLKQMLDHEKCAADLVEMFPHVDVPKHVRRAASGLTPEEVASRKGIGNPQKYLIRYLENVDRDRIKAERERAKSTAAYDSLPELPPQTFGGGR